MKLSSIIWFTLTGLLMCLNGFSQNPLIENRRWVLDKISDPETGKVQYVEEYHYLEFRGGSVSFAIDCNSCSAPYEFVSKDTVQIEGPGMCTRKGCLERDVIRVEYNGKYKIWRKGMYLVVQTENGDHFYK